MFTKQSSRARRHAITLLAIYVIALLLPVHIALAAELADSCEESSAGHWRLVVRQTDLIAPVTGTFCVLLH